MWICAAPAAVLLYPGTWALKFRIVQKYEAERLLQVSHFPASQAKSPRRMSAPALPFVEHIQRKSSDICMRRRRKGRLKGAVKLDRKVAILSASHKKKLSQRPDVYHRRDALIQHMRRPSIHSTAYTAKLAVGCGWARTFGLAGERVEREFEALVQRHQEGGGGAEGEDEAHAVLHVLLVRQLLGRLQPAPVAAAQLAQQRQRLQPGSARVIDRVRTGDQRQRLQSRSAASNQTRMDSGKCATFIRLLGSGNVAAIADPALLEGERLLCNSCRCTAEVRGASKTADSGCRGRRYFG